MAAQQPQPQPSSSPSPSPAHRDLNPDDYGGLQVVEQGLEVAEPRQGLSQSKTWEQHSALPEVSTTSYPEVYHDAKPAELGNHPALAGQGAPGGYGGYAGLPTPSTGVVSPDHAYLGGRNPYDQTPPGRRICGLRKNVFWAILAIGIFAIVAAVAIGVGVGIGTRNSNDSAASARCVNFLFMLLQTSGPFFPRLESRSSMTRTNFMFPSIWSELDVLVLQKMFLD